MLKRKLVRIQIILFFAIANFAIQGTVKIAEANSAAVAIQKPDLSRDSTARFEGVKSDSQTTHEFKVLSPNPVTFELPPLAQWIKVVGSAATITGLIWAIFWAIFGWNKNAFNRKKALVNALLQELRHNLSINENIFFKDPSSVELRYLYCRLDSLKKHDNYPNPTDGLELKHGYLRKNTFTWRAKGFPRSPLYFVSLEDQAKSRIVGSGEAIGLISDRIILNLGHLHYSVDRHNNNVSGFNSEVDKLPKDTPMPAQFEFVYQEYMNWTHYRLYFLMLDLLDSVPIKYFIDDNFVLQALVKGDRIKKKSWLSRFMLNRKLTRLGINPDVKEDVAQEALTETQVTRNNAAGILTVNIPGNEVSSELKSPISQSRKPTMR